jgi:MarR-like DNA-binding transcriptional regulator SgrR of sgrS sRNA
MSLPTKTEASPVKEQHYSVNELAALWNLSPDTVRRLFEQEPGVLIIRTKSGRYSRRRYITLRIPESVAERVHRRLSRV